MSGTLKARLARLEEFARATAAQRERLYISLSNTKIKVVGLSNIKMEFEAETPLQAVETIENYILKKVPEHVILSYGIDDIFDLFPEMRAAFGDFAPLATSQITAGDYYASLDGLPLKHIFLFSHVHTWGRDCGANREKGIICTDADFERMLPDLQALFAALMDILNKEQHWRDTSGRYKRNTAHYSYGNMQYGKDYLQLQKELAAVR